MASSSRPKASSWAGVSVGCVSLVFPVVRVVGQRSMSTSPMGTETQICTASSSAVEMAPVVRLRTIPLTLRRVQVWQIPSGIRSAGQAGLLGLVEQWAAVVGDVNPAAGERDPAAAWRVRNHSVAGVKLSATAAGCTARTASTSAGGPQTYTASGPASPRTGGPRRRGRADRRSGRGCCSSTRTSGRGGQVLAIAGVVDRADVVRTAISPSYHTSLSVRIIDITGVMPPPPAIRSRRRGRGRGRTKSPAGADSPTVMPGGPPGAGTRHHAALMPGDGELIRSTPSAFAGEQQRLWRRPSISTVTVWNWPARNPARGGWAAATA